MENFFYEDRFCSDIEDFIASVFDGDEDVVRALPEDWKEKVFFGDQQPIVTFNSEMLVNLIDEDRFSEDGDEDRLVLTVLKKYKSELELILNKINEEVPKLYYPSGESDYITKEDLLQVL